MIFLKKNSYENIINNCHNFLYTKGIIGSKAQNDIMKIFTIFIINYFNINGNKYIINLIENYKIINLENHNYYLDYLKNISLILIPENRNNNENEMWKLFVQECLSIIFPNIYSKDDYIFNCKNNLTLYNLINIISEFNINEFKDGDIQEFFLNYQGNKNSKELGQFFTPHEIIKTILIECGFKKLIENFNNISIYDPCLGTGGLLCYTYHYCKSIINNENIYGCEIEYDTMKLGIVSLMIFTNNYNKNILKCNSLIENPYLFEDKKFDIIFTNPPFGTKTDYKELEKDFNYYKKNNYPTSILNFKDIYNIKANSGIILFIQNIIYLLKDGGISCIILPDGELMIGKKTINIRKFILDNCKILKIITINSGAFINTNIKTKALIIQKGDYDNYNQEIEYIEININGVNNLGFEKLNKNLYFNKNIIDEEKYNEDIEIKKLGEICEIIKGDKIKSSLGCKNGLYPLYYCSILGNLYLDNYSYDGYGIIINKTNRNGKCMIYLAIGKYNVGETTIHFKMKTLELTKYIYYYLRNNLNKIEKYYRGINQKSITYEDLLNLKIPIPSIEKREDIIIFFDNLNDIIENNKKKIEKINKNNNLYLKINLNNYEIKTLGEISIINKGHPLNKNEIIDGIYDVIGGGNIIGKHNKYNRDGEEIILSRVGEININYIEEPYYLTDNGFSIKSINENIINKYLYYFLLYNKQLLKNLYYGTAQKVISNTNLKLIKILIPKIEKQKEIIKYLDFNNEILKNLEKENNMEDLFKQIIK